MPNIPLSALSIRYESEQQIMIRGWRWRASVNLVDENGALVPHRCIVDTGAPLSVLPFSLWKGRRLQSTLLGTQWKSRGRIVTHDLLWQGVPCEFREATLFLVDSTTAVQTGPHRFVAKFALQPLSPNLERVAVVGGNFLADNGIDLVLGSTAGVTGGYLVVPGP